MYQVKRELNMGFIICEIDKVSLRNDEIILKPIELDGGYIDNKKFFNSQEEAEFFFKIPQGISW
jgi:hypothetical protein